MWLTGAQSITALLPGQCRTTTRACPALGWRVAERWGVRNENRSRQDVPYPYLLEPLPLLMSNRARRRGPAPFDSPGNPLALPFPTASDTSPFPPPFTHLYHSNWRLESVPPPSFEPSQCPRPNTELPNAAPPILSPAHQNHQYHPQTTPILPHSPPSHAQRPTQINGNERK